MEFEKEEGGMAKNTYRIEILLNKGKKWFWHLKRNGRILAHSESYSSLRKAKNTAMALSAGLGGCVIINRGEQE
jgi:uncharacterized protein YegP (UPF0339 family)